MHDLGHIISVVSRSHWVFCVLQQTPSSWRPNRGWSDPGLCPSGILLPPLLSPLQPEPSGSFFCCLHIVAHGSSSVSTCYAQRSVGLAQGVTGKSPAAQLPFRVNCHCPVPGCGKQTYRAIVRCFLWHLSFPDEVNGLGCSLGVSAVLDPLADCLSDGFEDLVVPPSILALTQCLGAAAQDVF